MRDKIFNNKIAIIVLAIISVIAGIHLVFAPETVSPFIIRSIGFVWFVEGLLYAESIRKG